METGRPTTVALVGGKGEASPAAQPQKEQLREVGLQGSRRLLKHLAGQIRRVSEPLIVGVIADLAMGPPDGIGQALALAMGGEAAGLSHKAKRGAAREPSKPVGRIGLKV